MTPRVTETEDRTGAVAIAERARKLFAGWTTEEEAGQEGEISWEESEKALDEYHFSHRERFSEQQEVARKALLEEIKREVAPYGASKSGQPTY